MDIITNAHAITRLLLLVIIMAWVANGRLRHQSRWGCRRCPPGWGVVSPCTRSQDVTCSPCQEGRSYSPHNSYRLPCFPCSRCGQDLFVAHRCSVRKDTVCDACESNFHGPKAEDYYFRCVTTMPMEDEEEEATTNQT